MNVPTISEKEPMNLKESKMGIGVGRGKKGEGEFCNYIITSRIKEK